MSRKIGFILSHYEAQNLNTNEPDTSVSLMLECLNRNHRVFICSDTTLSLNGNTPKAIFKELCYNHNQYTLISCELIALEELDIIIKRSNPPVDMKYIYNTYILDHLSGTKTLVVNRPSALRKANEKIYINNFTSYVPKSTVTASAEVIKDFLNEQGKIIIKPLDNYGGNGIFALNKGDKNINSIIDLATKDGQTAVIAQEYLNGAEEGDKRIILLGGKPIASIKRIPFSGDFRANMTKGGYLEKSDITDYEKEMCKTMAPKLVQDGIYFAGIDVIDGKIIEMNVTSPGFFIRKINPFMGVKLEKTVIDYIEEVHSNHMAAMLDPTMIQTEKNYLYEGFSNPDKVIN